MMPHRRIQEAVDLLEKYQREAMELSKRLIQLRMELEKADVISEKLAKYNIYMSSFFQLSNDLLTVASDDGYFKIVNKAWTEVLGYTADDLTSRQWIEFVHPDDIPKTIAIMDVLRKAPLYGFQNRYRKKDGDYVTLSWNCVMERDGTIYAVARVVS